MLRILVRLAVALVLLAVLITTIGYALPRDHVASASRQISLPPHRVFLRITDVERFPDWRKDVERVEVITQSPLTWREHAGGDVITFEIVASAPPERLVSRIADPDLPFGGTWTYELRPEGAGTRLTITERGEIYNPIFRFVSRFILGYTATIEGYLDALVDDTERRTGRVG
jgi:uncharacterized protein YndB with AHSA1/START domain